MKRIAIFCFLVGILFFSQLALADGGIFNPPEYEKHVYIPSQKAAIIWDGTNETMILSTKIKTEDIIDMAWVIPIPSKIKPVIEEGNIEIFYDLADMFRPPPKERGFGIMGAAGAKAGEVEVVEAKKIDIYYIVILRATNATALTEWLNKHNFAVPDTATNILQNYVGEDFYFIANRINLPNKLNESVTDQDRACAAEITLPSAYSIEAIESRISYQFENIKECQNASFEAVKILKELELGISTPLKFVFQPKQPFYPLELSSINDGDVQISVYFISQKPVKDSSNLLSVSKMVQTETWFKDKYNLTNQNYVTYLTYDGSLKNLNADSYFEQTNYNPSLDPKYVGPGERVAQIGEVILIIIILIIMFVAIPLIFVGVLFFSGFAIERLSRRFKETKFYYLPIIIVFLISLLITFLIFNWYFIQISLLILSLLVGFYKSREDSKMIIWLPLLVFLIAYAIFLILSIY